MTAADEAAARRKAAREAAKVREIYEEMVLHKTKEPLVSIGASIGAMGHVPGSAPRLTQVGPAPSNAPAKKEERELAGIAGD